jgi:hypothetical protein
MLSTVHQILIAGSIALAAIVGLRGIWLWRAHGRASDALVALGAVLVAAGAALYLRRFRAKLAARGGGPERGH